MKNYIRLLFTYNGWANQRVLDTCTELTPEEFLRGEGSSTAVPSIRDTLVHTMGAHWLMLSRWQGGAPKKLLDPADFGTLALIQARWSQIEAETQANIEAVTEDELAATMHYTNTRGDPFSYPRWLTIVHTINHATQHRSEVALLLTQANHSPDELDVFGMFGPDPEIRQAMLGKFQ